MSMLRMLAGSSSAPPVTAIEDVFSAYTYTGNGATQTITNGIDLAGKGGLVWTKRRDLYDHALVDTIRGVNSFLITDSTVGNTSCTGDFTSFGAAGYTLAAPTTGSWFNVNGNNHVSWSFAQAAKFFKVAQVVVAGGVSQTVDLSSLGTVGMVTVKRTDSASAWFVWHRSQTAGDLTYLNTTAAQTADTSISVSGTTLTLTGGVIANGTYTIYAWAHDTSANGLIQCGIATGSSPTINTGWEIQAIVYKQLSGGTDDWVMLDTARFLSQTNGGVLRPNTSGAEALFGAGYLVPTATGFQVNGLWAAQPYIYMAIRRGPMKLPTVGTQVYNAIARNATGAAATVTGVGFPPDLVIPFNRVGNPAFTYDRLRGATQYLQNNSTAAEGANTSTQELVSFDMDGIHVGTSVIGSINYSTNAYINWFFRRYPGVHDQICYNGTGANKTEAIPLLAAPPELWLVKGRSGATTWVFGSSLLANTQKIVCPSPNGVVTDATAWNSTFPTATAFSLGTLADVNTNAATYTAYFWASLAGICKVILVTGNGSSQNLNFGFSGNARFLMVIRTTASTAQDIFIWDSTRGINGSAATDPHLSLNTTAAEVTADSSVEPYTTGITIVENSTTHINVNGAVYLMLAYA